VDKEQDGRVPSFYSAELSDGKEAQQNTSEHASSSRLFPEDQRDSQVDLQGCAYAAMKKQ